MLLNFDLRLQTMFEVAIFSMFWGNPRERAILQCLFMSISVELFEQRGLSSEFHFGVSHMSVCLSFRKTNLELFNVYHINPRHIIAVNITSR